MTKIKELRSEKYPNEVFTVESDGEQFQAVYPEALAWRYASLYTSEQEAWDAIQADAKAEGLTLS